LQKKRKKENRFPFIIPHSLSLCTKESKESSTLLILYIANQVIMRFKTWLQTPENTATHFSTFRADFVAKISSKQSFFRIEVVYNLFRFFNLCNILFNTFVFAT